MERSNIPFAPLDETFDPLRARSSSLFENGDEIRSIIAILKFFYLHNSENPLNFYFVWTKEKEKVESIYDSKSIVAKREMQNYRKKREEKKRNEK